MSVHCLSRVWEYSNSKGGNLLVLLALADIAKPSGYCWPSYAYIAKMSRLSERQTIRIVGQLVESGELVKIQSERRRSNEYVVWVWNGEPTLRKCTRCGTYEIPELYLFHEHHIVPKSDGGTDAPNNLSILCRACHNKTHAELRCSDKMSDDTCDTPSDASVTPPLTLVSPEPLINRNINQSEEEGENPFRVYEQEIGPLTPSIAEGIGELVKEHTAHWVCEAFRECSKNGKRSLGYAEAILSRWAVEGYGTAPKWERKTYNNKPPSLDVPTARM